MTNVTPHPALALADKLKSARKDSGHEQFEFFREAVETGVPRKPILEFFSSHKGEMHYSKSVYKEIIHWGCVNAFRTKAPGNLGKNENNATAEAPHVIRENEKESESTLHKSNRDVVHALGIASAAKERKQEQFLGEIAKTHPYGFFPPGWEVHTTEWLNHFENDDPCPTIALYLRHLFSEPPRYSTRKPVFTLHQTDKDILDLILSGCAQTLSNDNDFFPGTDVSVIRKILNAACGAWLWGDTINCFTLDFLDYVSSAPEEIGKGLIRFWIDEDPEWSSCNNKVSDEVLAEQIAFFSCCIVKNLTSRGVPDNKSYPIKELFRREEYDEIPNIHLSVDELLVLKYRLWSTSVDLGYRVGDAAASEAIYNARDRVFGGSFPFPMDESYQYIGALENDHSFWLACLSRYTGKDYSEADDPYRVFVNGYDPEKPIEEKSIGDAYDLRRSTKRFDAFLQADNDMAAAGFDELSNAWWAFFIASQALAFPHMGLSPGQIGVLFRVTAPLLPNKMIEKSLRLALKRSDESSHPLHSRILKNTINSLLKGDQDSRGNVTEFRSTRLQNSEFLKDRIGEKTWNSLSSGSRQDLIDAEEMWGQRYSEFGAGRQDWGGLVAFYARVIESELRDNLREELDSLARAGLEIKERTLGGCVVALREANKEIRLGNTLNLAESCIAKVQRIYRFFADEAAFIVQQRNYAAHGNRDRLINGNEFHRWRNAIFTR